MLDKQYRSAFDMHRNIILWPSVMVIDFSLSCGALANIVLTCDSELHFTFILTYTDLIRITILKLKLNFH